VSQTVPVAQATDDEGVLGDRVQEALGELVGAAREGLLALSVEVGLGVLRELLEEEVDELVGPKGKWNPGRATVRHGHERRGDIGRPARPGQAPAGQDRGWRVGSAVGDL
jgi:hypothetical protein